MALESLHSLHHKHGRLAAPKPFTHVTLQKRLDQRVSLTRQPSRQLDLWECMDNIRELVHGHSLVYATEPNLGREDFLVQVRWVFGAEWWVARQHFVRKGTK